MTRFYALLAAALAWSACGGDPEPVPTTPSTVEADTPLGPSPASEIPADSVVTPDVLPAGGLDSETPDTESAGAETPIEPRPPATPRPTPRAEPPVAPAPAVPAPAVPAPPRADPQPERPAPSTADRRGAEQLWARFQDALRARDASRIDDVLHTTVRVRGQDYDRDGPQVQEVVKQFAENPDLAGAYLAASADELAVDGPRATFASRASYTLEGVDYEVTVFGTMREVSPGTWRIVELGSRE